MVALRFATQHGVGIAQLPTMMKRQDLASSALVEVLPQWVPQSGIVHAVFLSRRGVLPSVRELLDFLVVEFATFNAAKSA